MTNEQTQLRAAHIAAMKAEAAYTSHAIRHAIHADPQPVTFLDAETVEQLFLSPVSRSKLIAQIEALGTLQVLS